MNKKIIGIFICTLLVANISAVIAIPEGKVDKNREGRYYFLEDSLGQKEIRYIDDDIENDLLQGYISKTHDNLAPNPSFEEGDGIPTGWIYYSKNANGIYHWDSNYSHSGEKSVGSLNLTYKNNYSAQVIWETTDFIPVDLVKNVYEFSHWNKFIGTQVVKGQVGDLCIEFYDKNYLLLGARGAGSGFSSDWIYSNWNTSSITDSRKYDTKYVKLQLIHEDLYFINEQPDPLIEIRFDDVYFGVWNTIPNTPIITGQTNGRVRTLYDYTIKTTDPDQDNVQYKIDWGDNTTQTTDLSGSGEEISVSHIWGIERNYNVRVKAIDENGLESDWVTLTVTMPCSYNKPMPQFLELLFQRFPNAFPILRQLLGY
jgi:hypothetical protein